MEHVYTVLKFRPGNVIATLDNDNDTKPREASIRKHEINTVESREVVCRVPLVMSPDFEKCVV